MEHKPVYVIRCHDLLEPGPFWIHHDQDGSLTRFRDVAFETTDRELAFSIRDKVVGKLKRSQILTVQED